MRAYSLIRPEPCYRADSFERGLRAAGHTVSRGWPDRVDSDTLVLIWNRYGAIHERALIAERAGATILVAENGYLGRGGTSPKFDVHPGGPKPGDYYALAAYGHNGQGAWGRDDGSRFRALEVPLLPWRPDGPGHVLVAPNRSFGIPGRMMDPRWPEDVARRLRKATDREIRVRAHPGNDAPKRPLERDFEGAYAVVIWSSSAGVHALVRGIPVVCEAPFWICKSAALPSLAAVETVLPAAAIASDRRLLALERMACAQWTMEEISSGEPFANVLRAAREGKK